MFSEYKGSQDYSSRQFLECFQCGGPWPETRAYVHSLIGKTEFHPSYLGAPEQRSLMWPPYEQVCVPNTAPSSLWVQNKGGTKWSLPPGILKFSICPQIIFILEVRKLIKSILILEVRLIKSILNSNSVSEKSHSCSLKR